MKKSILKKMLLGFMVSVITMLTFSGGDATGQNGGVDSAPVIITNPSTLYFDDTYLASSSQQTLTIFNAGDANLVISQGIFDGPFETYNSFPITVAPGTAWNQVIHFKPFELGLIEGTVTYMSNDPVTPSKVVNLIGNCIDDPINGWEWIYTGYNYILMDLEFPEGQDQTGYAVGMNNTLGQMGIILKTTDGGTTWDQISANGIAGVERCSFPTLETGYAAGWTDQIMKTTDGGETWQNLNVISNVYYYSSIEFKDENNGVILVKPTSAAYTAYYTNDGGVTWTEGTGCTAFEDVTWAGDDTWYATGYEYICKSTDNGATWTDVYTQGALLLGSDFLTPEYGIATGDYGQIITTKDGGATWTEDIVMDWLFHKPFIWDNDTAYVTGTPEYIYKTTDSGETWESDYDGNWMKAFYNITFTNNYTGFVSASGGIVLRKKPTTQGEAVIAATPNPLGFEDTNVGETAEETLTIENTGDATLEVTNINSTNSVFTFSLTAFTVEPGETQDVSVYFDPVAAGLVQGTLQITNNSALNPYEVAVSGTGVAAGPAPVIITNPSTLYFDDTYIASRTQQSLTIFNAGTADLVISQAVFDGPWETYNGFPITVAPGGAWNQVIHFKPFELGLNEGTVTYMSNDPVTPAKTVNLIGNCIDTPINGWEWIYTGYNYILTDIEFPEGQSMIGYTGGQTVTYNGLGIMLKTTDGGDTWEPLTEPGIDGIERFSFPTLETGYAAGWTDQIMKTTDGGETWENLNVVSNVYYYAGIEFKDENTGILIVNMNSSDIKTMYTSDGGATWSEGTGNEAFLDVTWAGGNTWYSTGYSNVCKSTDNGATWTTVFTEGALLIGADFLTPDYGIAAGDYGQVVTTHDGGATWETDQILDILFHKPFIWDEDTAYVVGTPEYIYKTTDDGENWISDFDGNWEKALYACTFTNNYTGFVSGGSNGIVLRKKPGVLPELFPPTNLLAEVDMDDVTLTWDAPSLKDLTGYNVYRDGNKVNTAVVSATNYYDENVDVGNHLYQVSAVYSDGESPLTDFVEIFIEGGTGKIQGFVRDAVSNTAIDNATILALNMDNGTMTSNTPFGSHYSMIAAPGNYDVTCSADGYESYTANDLMVVENENTNYTFYLTPADGQEVLTGLNDINMQEINVYPNPAREMINVVGLGIHTIEMMNYHGQVVYTNTNPTNNNNINISHIASGIYFMKVESVSGMKMEKIIIE